VEGFNMEEGRDPVRDCTEAVCDGLRQIGDFSYAIMPKDVAHALGDLKKAVLSQIRCLVDWETKWIDERVAGGDRKSGARNVAARRLTPLRARQSRKT
jgi:hypothetical protein